MVGNFPSDVRRPISLEIFSKLWDLTLSVCVSPYEALLFQIAFVLAFFGALHISELILFNMIK